ncbi:MAG: SDR family oxidoreductase [Pseudomonadota bacterium]
MQVLVTGASGFVGLNLVRALLAEGHTVRCLVRGAAPGLDRLEVEQVRGDTTEPDSLPPAFAGVELVFHLAALIQVGAVDPEPLFKCNVQGPHNVAAACLAAGVRRMVHCSSIHALYDHPLYAPIDETRALALSDDCQPYARSKAEGELKVLEAVARGLDAVICNPTAVIGPWDLRPSHLGELLILLQQRRLPALIDAAYDWVDVRDVAWGLMAAAREGRRSERYLLSGHRASMKELAQLTERFSGAKAPTLVAPMALARLGAPFVAGWARIRGTRPLYSPQSLAVLRGNTHITHAKASRELGYRPRPLEETIRDFFAWYLENPAEG